MAFQRLLKLHIIVKISGRQAIISEKTYFQRLLKIGELVKIKDTPNGSRDGTYLWIAFIYDRAFIAITL